jgi:cation diffusion facilitator CzcD-associated flavoprotein CzcO
MAKTLLEDGFDVSILEQNDQVGGTFSDQGHYIGMHHQIDYGLFEFADMPDRNDPGFGTAENKQKYFEAYAKKFKVWECLQLNTQVIGLQKENESWCIQTQPIQPKNALQTLHKQAEQHEIKTQIFDFVVIANGLHYLPYVPTVPNMNQFQGQVYHDNQIKDLKKLEGKQVIVVGGGKSAIDMSLLAGDTAQSTRLLFRKANWMISHRHIGGLVPHRYVLYTRFMEALLPQYPNKHCVRLIDKIPKKIKKCLWRVIEWDVLFTSGMLGAPKAARPLGQLPHDLAVSGVWPKKYGPYLKQKKILPICGEIAHFTEQGVVLASGEKLSADVVIFATGHRKAYPYLDRSIKLQDHNGDFELYRGLIPIGTENLAILGFRQIFNNLFSFEISAHWVADYFQKRLPNFPSSEQMKQEITQRVAWMSHHFPNTRGFDWGPYNIHCIDELMLDMQLPCYRTNNWLSEYFAPGANPKRYRNLAQQRNLRDAGKISSAKKSATWCYIGVVPSLLLSILLVTSLILFK